MRGMRRLFVATLAVAAAAGALPAAGGVTKVPWTAGGGLEVFAKYNSNLTLLSSRAPVDRKDAFLTELNGRLTVRGAAGGWRLNGRLTGLANLHAEHATENWYFSRAHIAASHPFAAGMIEVANEGRYYTVPDRNTFDFYRNVALVTWRRPLGARWQLRTGYESILTRYPQSRRFDYTVNGALFELRQRWSLGLTTYTLLDLQAYGGEASPQDAAAEASPQDGRRVTGRIGCDWLFGGRHALSATYSLQVDEADLGVQQIGDFQGAEGNQDLEAEFDLVKQKATALYSVTLSRRLRLSAYGEWIHKRFDDEERFLQQLPRRTDNLMLTSAYLRFRLDEGTSLKLRYLYRANRSTVELLEYDDHVFYLGVERRRH